MSKPTNRDDSWELVWGQPYINDARLASALEEDLRNNPRPDFRTRLLIRDAARALKQHWGPRRFSRWLGKSAAGTQIGLILKEKLGQPGYHDISRRLVASPGKDQVEQVFELLGRNVHDRVEIYIAGSIPTLIAGLTQRPTDDIDLVDEVPADIRKQRSVLDQIQAKFGLTLGRVQAHYLPANWRNRRKFLGDFGGIRAYLVEVYDVFVSKLSSKQEKHQDDLRVLAPKLDKEKARQRLLTDGKAFLESRVQKATIEAKWKFIFREELFPAETTKPSGAGRKPRRGKGKNGS
jgi:hypothetical protein